MFNLKMSLDKSDFISLARLNKYSEDPNKAFIYHLYNTALCEVFYSSLSYLEIILRNKIDKILTYKYGALWFNLYEDDIAKNLHDKNIDRSDKNKLISELNFGFWTFLFSKKNRNLWTPELLKQLFYYNKKHLKIEKIAYELDLIRKFRNKIYHYGSILTMNKSFLTVSGMHSLIHTYIRYLSGNCVLKHLNAIDNFNKVYAELKNKNITNKLLK